ncbi:hypothetical protein BpHYR1_019290 [Brachionus plicatilis]|uniref:Uncharacterized protein n=1 Tax=Brachionus plicatilis TaxID=10195 RepID=A0A3M7RH21_BRAPC|nr:hypothetical protein BpHYR1_019290 [Brachionus plicatilis]
MVAERFRLHEATFYIGIEPNGHGHYGAVSQRAEKQHAEMSAIERNVVVVVRWHQMMRLQRRLVVVVQKIHEENEILNKYLRNGLNYVAINIFLGLDRQVGQKSGRRFHASLGRDRGSEIALSAELVSEQVLDMALHAMVANFSILQKEDSAKVSMARPNSLNRSSRSIQTTMFGDLD